MKTSSYCDEGYNPVAFHRASFSSRWVKLLKPRNLNWKETRLFHT